MVGPCGREFHWLILQTTLPNCSATRAGQLGMEGAGWQPRGQDVWLVSQLLAHHSSVFAPEMTKSHRNSWEETQEQNCGWLAAPPPPFPGFLVASLPDHLGTRSPSPVLDRHLTGPPHDLFLGPCI